MKERGCLSGGIHLLYSDYTESVALKLERESEKDPTYWLLIENYWSQKGVNWLSRSRQKACKENMLNSNSDWPHGSVDAAFVIASA